MTPVRPPQPSALFGPVDQLMTPMIKKRAAVILKHRPAGIAGAGAKPRAFAIRRRIDEPDLQISGLAGRDEIGRAQGAAGFAVAALGQAIARDGEAVAGRRTLKAPLNNVACAASAPAPRA